MIFVPKRVLIEKVILPMLANSIGITKDTCDYLLAGLYQYQLHELLEEK